MYNRQVDSEHDALRARFTVWLEKLIKNAKINYLEEYKKEIITISIDSLFEDEFLVNFNTFSNRPEVLLFCDLIPRNVCICKCILQNIFRKNWQVYSRKNDYKKDRWNQIGTEHMPIRHKPYYKHYA